MRLSITVWTIIALNAFVIGESIVLGWIAQDVAAEVVEERFAKDMITNVSGFLADQSFPLSDSLMGYLRQMLNLDWVAIDSVTSEAVGSSLPKPLAGEFVQGLNKSGPAGVIRIANKGYRFDTHDIPARDGGAGPQRVRLCVLIPVDRFQDARDRASKRIAAVVAPATGVATSLAVLLAFVITGPIKKLSREMIRLSGRDESLPGTHLTRPAAPDARTALTHHGPKETRDLAAAFYGLLDHLASARLLLAQNERLATLGKICLSVAHELRNPLSGIKMNIRVLQDHIASTEREVASSILREIDRMGLYLDELMSLAPGDGSIQKTLTPVPVRLTSLADSVLTIMAGRLRHGRITVKKEYPDAETSVNIDPSQVRQAVMNLVVNAIEAMPTGGMLGVSVRSNGSMTKLAVSDTGRGVPSTETDIFEAFATNKPDGIGLGLYLSKQIVSRHGGRIGYDTSAAGACFWIEFPTATSKTQ